ncbi:MAG: hypothetical protein ACLQF0_10755 [Dissulfurispiraceae bacterium]
MSAIKTIRKAAAGEGEYLFFDALKLPLSANLNVFMAAILDSVLRWGSALLAPVTVDPCIASKNKYSPSPAFRYFVSLSLQ